MLPFLESYAHVCSDMATVGQPNACGLSQFWPVLGYLSSCSVDNRCYCYRYRLEKACKPDIYRVKEAEKLLLILLKLI